jgi:hypothetical protein
MPKASTDTKPYLAKTRIQHDQDTYEAGEELELTDAQAKQLLDVKAVEPAPKKEPKAPPAGGQGKEPGASDKGKKKDAKKEPPTDNPGGQDTNGKAPEGQAQS